MKMGWGGVGGMEGGFIDGNVWGLDEQYEYSAFDYRLLVRYRN